MHAPRRAMFFALGFMLAHGAEPAQKTKAEPVTVQQLWSYIKRELTGPDAQEYFDSSFKGAMVPGGAGGLWYLTGTLLSAEPREQPGVLVLAISDRSTPEVTLRFKDSKWNDSHIVGPLIPGSLIQFEGVATSFTKEPFMVTFDVSTTPRNHIRIVGRQPR
ncbi:MAG: hypothetical protein JWO48_87 [Bryobacterales bacterium]|nr:hypothetical protein [Bryobacterales bacterium]